ncbi:MAG: hypothetical protein U0792_04175 [Gemmataceae bacterium]
MASLNDLPEYLLVWGVILLIACSAAATARWLAQTANENTLSLRREWLSAWGGAASFLIVVLFAAPDGPGRREKDLLVVVLEGVVWGGLAASLVETAASARRAVRGEANGRVILWFGLASLIFVVLTVLVQMLHVERDNQHFRSLMMRRSAYFERAT